MSRRTVIAGAGVAALILAGIATYGVMRGGGPDAAPSGAATAQEIPGYRAGGLEIGVATVPATPRVGDNRLIVELHTPGGEPVSDVTIEAYAEMPAMGAMPAMRAPADLEQVAPGRYEGSMNLSMRGEWPLTIAIDHPQGQEDQRLQFDLATDREGLTIATGGAPLEGGPAAAETAHAVAIDHRRRQMIGLETAAVTHRNLVQSIRAIGEITPDERSLSEIVLRFDGVIGDLVADHVGLPVRQGQVLFTVYGPELLAAQREYLETLKRRRAGGAGDPVIRAARQRLRLWDLAEPEIAALEQRGTPAEYVPIRAPRSGILVARNIAAGSAAARGQTLLGLADLSRIWVDAKVFEADLELVRAGMQATVTLPYLPGRAYPASLDYVYPVLSGDSRTGRVRLSLDNPDGMLKPGMYAEVTLEADLGQHLAVPEEAVIVAGTSRVVFVDLGDGRLNPVRIKTGRRAQGYVEVLEGLAPGDRIVTSGNFLIAAETRLKTGIEQW
ncbi:MAG: efflux RND transporter periplasmic adaptor subunit [Pseudomonadota bacterium]